jgi:hypothetical protein
MSRPTDYRREAIPATQPRLARVTRRSLTTLPFSSAVISSDGLKCRCISRPAPAAEGPHLTFHREGRSEARPGG